MTKPPSFSSATTFEMTDKDFNRIRELIYKHAGLVLSDFKREMVYGRLVRRLRDLGLTRFEEYLAVLDKDFGQETERFINAMTTNLTSFFRESHHFPILADHIRQHRGGRTANIWCAASSTGEEPYSIAMTMADLFSTLNHIPVKILATDLDTAVLATAKAGIYSKSVVEKLPDNQVKLYFKTGQDIPEGKIKIKEELQRMITFSKLNLLDQRWSVQGSFDAIFCRNVLIYFDRSTQRRILERFVTLLRPEGLLFVGHSESLFHSADLFKSIGHTTYKQVSQ